MNEHPTPAAPEGDTRLSTLPVLPLRDLVVLPETVIPVLVARVRSRALVQHVIDQDLDHVVLSAVKTDTEDPGPADLYATGTLARIVQVGSFPDGNFRLVIEGERRVRLRAFTMTEPFFEAEVEVLEDRGGDATTVEALRRQIIGRLDAIRAQAPYVDEQVVARARSIESAGALGDFVASSLNLSVDHRQELLETLDVEQRLNRLIRLLARELQVLEVGTRIQEEVESEVQKGQREFLLRKQMEAIKRELGEEGDDGSSDDYRTRIADSGMPDEARTEAERELDRLETLADGSPERGVITSYLDWMLRVPWNVLSDQSVDVVEAGRILDEDHHGLREVKDRILEYLAVMQLTTELNGPILCLVGPPGVGKTSLGESLARALGREFVRLSLGGVRDEAELRGHRRTYIGALPGRIVQSLTRAGTRNPVIMLDEVDKIGADYRGDPSAALLEILDPAQNDSFRDHYLDVPLDLSQVVFVTTANVLHTIPGPLRDRMEIIEVPGYTRDEKFEIARRYLVPRQAAAHGLEADALDITDDALRRIIGGHTREAGVRELERRIAAVSRKAARDIVEGAPTPVTVDIDGLEERLGVERYRDKVASGEDAIGVTTGLAVTGVGGDVLFVEASLVPGSGALTITGQLGDVMRESAQAAVTYARGSTEDTTWFAESDIHIHVPEGAVPKDGPSAGVTMTTALVSAVTRRPVKRTVAMTGEVTLRGNVLPIGGVKEKVLAAHLAGLETVLLPIDNAKDLEEIPDVVRAEMDIRLVSTMDDVLEVALAA